MPGGNDWIERNPIDDPRWSDPDSDPVGDIRRWADLMKQRSQSKPPEPDTSTRDSLEEHSKQLIAQLAKNAGIPVDLLPEPGTSAEMMRAYTEWFREQAGLVLDWEVIPQPTSRRKTDPPAAPTA